MLITGMKVPLMVTGGFRSRSGMHDALSSQACNLIGLARPAAIDPCLPKETDASVSAPAVHVPWDTKLLCVGILGAGAELVC